MTIEKSYCHHEGGFNHFQGLLYYTYIMSSLCYTIKVYMIIRLGVRIKKCTLFVVTRQVPQYYSIVASCIVRTNILVFV